MKRLPWYRDRASLAAAIAKHGTVTAAADAYGTPRTTVQHWANAFGLGGTLARAKPAVPPRDPAHGHTYIVGAAGQSLVKIGRTAGDVRSRMATMQTGSPVPLLLLATLPHPRWEDVLHHHYAAARRQGEWFALELADVAALMRWACQAAGIAAEWPSDEDALVAGWDATSGAIEGVYGASAVRRWARQ